MPVPPYAIALKQAQYPTYILTDQASEARLEVVPERGGIITQWQLGDTQILYFDAERFKNPAQSIRGGIPILFPICGNLPDDTYTVDGKTYRLKQHGFARDLPWTVSDRGVRDGSEGGAFLTLTLNSTEETRRVYPFDFELTFTYRLQDNQLFLQQRFANKSDRPMPFSTGLHPYFQIDGQDQSSEPTNQAKSALQMTLPAERYLNQITQTEHAYSGNLDWSADELDIAFRPISGQTATATDPDRNVSIELTYASAYTTLVFWTVAGKDYYCLEPWSAPRNALNTGTDLLTLSPGESRTLSVSFTAKVA